MQVIQKRGHCPICGSIQAATNGRIAKHGYTVKYGFFAGTCAGAGKMPMEVSRVETDNFVVYLGQLIAAQLELAEQLKSGEKQVEFVTVGHFEKAKQIPFNEASKIDQEIATDAAIHKASRQAREFEAYAKMLKKLVAEIHGTPLIDIVKPEAPAAINYGDKKLSSKGSVYTVTRVERARIYCVSDKGVKGWLGRSAWRALKDIA